MSRDFRPCEFYFVDKRIGVRKAQKIVWHTADGDEIEAPLYDKDAIHKFPELSFLFGNFNSLYPKYKNNEKALSIFSDLEKKLKEVEREYEDNGYSEKGGEKCGALFNAELIKENSYDVIKEWFYGRLDNNFYYNIKNNDKFLQYIEDKIKEKGE